METTQEKRAAQRYSVTYDVEWDSGKGVTCDLSTSGIRFLTDTAGGIGLGQFLRLFIIVRRLGKAVSRLRCEGSVVRLDAHDTGMHVAVCFQDFQLEYAGGEYGRNYVFF